MKTWAAYCFQTLIEYLETKNVPDYPKGMPDPKYALFVTWTKGKDDDLRGCIGTFAQNQKLSQILSRYALISSLQDDRFEPVKRKEVESLSVGLSLLVNFQPVQDPLDWVVGKHGIEIDFTVNGREYGSTFLPEVA